MEEFSVNTPNQGFVDITNRIHEIVARLGTEKGLCQIFVPHTTAAVTINENADPDVVSDMMNALDHIVPRLNYRHNEGNSPAHVKSSLLGCSVTVPIVKGRLYLGTWQGIYLCEFDGPRTRKVCINLL
jgi:secondary thiamine-phosphate synthase enzyme